MSNVELPRGIWAMALALATLLPSVATAADPVMVFSPGKPLAFDFSPSPGGGVPVGTFNNIGFTLNPDRPTQTIAVQQGRPQHEVIATFDYAGCARGQESLLERPVRDLAAGGPTFVDYVDIEIVPTQQTDLTWSGGVCFGFRTPSGWSWNLASTPLTIDSRASVVRGRVWVKQPNVDALKLAFDYSVPTQALRAVTVVTQVLPIEIVKPTGDGR